ncbi:hypothetical protein DAI22_03g302200 [Oryza sativa Japonica Group]|nr:hypothetical protein DAI22_03g302200 [Oryza sativa Japonica Group]
MPPCAAAATAMAQSPRSLHTLTSFGRGADDVEMRSRPRPTSVTRRVPGPTSTSTSRSRRRYQRPSWCRPTTSSRTAASCLRTRCSTATSSTSHLAMWQSLPPRQRPPPTPTARGRRARRRARPASTSQRDQRGGIATPRRRRRVFLLHLQWWRERGRGKRREGRKVGPMCGWG